MRFVRKNSLLYLAFEKLGRFPELAHGIFTRRGGCSTGAYAEFNLGLRVGDDAEIVRRNRDAISGVMDGARLECLHQVHGTGIAIIEDANLNPVTPEADGAVTARPGRLLMIQVADCQAVMLYDPEHRAVANLHAGWRGSVGNIIAAGIETMRNRYGTDPETIVAGIWPSLGPCCAEFIHFRDEIPEAFWKYKDAKDRFDFWRISEDQLAAAGVPRSNIETAGICTKCNPHLFYSYRRSHVTGRFGAVIGLREK